MRNANRDGRTGPAGCHKLTVRHGARFKVEFEQVADSRMDQGLRWRNNRCDRFRMAWLDVDSVLDERIHPSDLENFRETYENQVRRGYPSANAVFTYGQALVRSTKSDVQEGIELLEELLKKEPDDMSKRDYVYFLAIGNARLKDYDRALAYIDVLLSAESHNRQAKELREVIEKRMKKDGLIGAAIIGGGAALVVGTIVAALFASKK